MKYDFQKIEKKWQKVWARRNFAAWHAKDSDRRQKFYILDMFPYPSGDGLHVGHVEGYTATDIYARWLRRRGFNVLHPIGWDAFGLPAENYAIKMQTHPSLVVKKNVARFRDQLQAMGFSYDWRREINTTDPAYYRSTQWIFLQLFKRGLAYKRESAINWCASCKTGIANEEVVDGACERCGAKVEKKFLPQWTLKITAYADRLLQDLETLDWPENIKEMQRNWIGRSEGYEVEFRVAGRQGRIKIFTTRIDTIFGATFLVLAPEHPLTAEVTSENEAKKVQAYIQEVLGHSDLERQSDAKIKSGVFSGSYAINPATREKIPIWISEYVIASYGTGAIMAVPAHDARDLEFARAFNLPIREVISADDSKRETISAPYEGEGILLNSGPFDRAHSASAKEKIAAYVSAQSAVRYKLRDWIFSRQRYWGEPIPLVFCEDCRKKLMGITNYQLPITKSAQGIENCPPEADPPLAEKLKIGNLSFTLGEAMNPGWVPLPESKLPLKLPDVKSYEPTGTGASPLAGIAEWVNVKCPRCGGLAKRETDTMPQWAGSCWYHLAYLLGNQKSKIKNQKSFWDQKILKYWLPVDFYVGGAEHAVLHLLYARFWHKFLFDIGLIPTSEPFQKLVNQGLILGEDGEKMSKSRENVVSPDEAIKQYGADSLRLYEMFMGPLEQAKPWDSQGIVGMHRFLNRVWELATSNSKFSAKDGSASGGKNQKSKLKPKTQISPKARASAAKDIKRIMHKTIKKVSEDIEAMSFNTAISSMMEFQNALSFQAHLLSKNDFQVAIRHLLLLLAPFAPHITEELQSQIHADYQRRSTRINQRQSASVNQRKSASVSIHETVWPKYDERWLKEENITYVLQVNGKVRDTIKAKAGLAEAEIITLAKKLPKIAKWLADKKIKRAIFVQDKLVNFAVD